VKYIFPVMIIIAFLVLGLFRLYPYNNGLEGMLGSELNDDWVRYARLGMDIKRNGLEISSVKGPYDWPAGFLYNYFVAVCFLIFGENLMPIYLIQHLMVGLSIALVYWTFKDRMSSIAAILFLFAMSGFAVLDMCKYYVIRLLSENLLFFIIALFFFFFVRGFTRNDLRMQLVSAFLVGLAMLTRPNLFLYGGILIIPVAGYYLKKSKKGILYIFLFMLIMGSTASLLGLRNYSVCGKWYILPTAKVEGQPDGLLRKHHHIPKSIDLSNTDAPVYAKLNKINENFGPYLEYLRQEPMVFVGHYVKNILFCFGFAPLLDEDFRLRPHWILMWIGYFAYLISRIIKKARMEIWEAAIHLYLALYIISLVAVARVQSYGFRYMLPLTNFVLFFFFVFFDENIVKRWFRRYTLER